MVSSAARFCGRLSGHVVCDMVTIRMRECDSAFCVRLERFVRLSPLLAAVWGVAGMLQTRDGVLDSLLYAWLQCACVAHVEQGYVTSGR